ncbi:probable 28S ribosomal protein S6, mitochondrial [Cimex lectularius]|uniref:Small ribosomal subunit protein bS6m n=1 Tax=Cimex lectularius TaxID=79782 RepID=A0A8I6RVU1_CIMLE|nr:probable 28S ribosomal protein S6, mitochondrial [Cimex lectularius]
MLTYELSVLLKLLPKEEMTKVLKRTASAIFEKGGVIKKLDNLGQQKLPYKTSKHGMVHLEAHYFNLAFIAPPSKIEQLEIEYERDVDIIRSKIYKSIVPSDFECRLEEELKPAPYRLEVQEMIEEMKKKEARRPSFKYNTNLDYYPFQK